MKNPAQINKLTEKVIGAAIEVHKELGPGLLESVYEHCLAFELSQIGVKHITQKALPVIYKNNRIDCGFRIDVLVEDKLIVELKAVDCVIDVHYAQLMTYMKLTDIKLGLLINFNVKLLKNGIKRIIL